MKIEDLKALLDAMLDLKLASIVEDLACIKKDVEDIKESITQINTTLFISEINSFEF